MIKAKTPTKAAQEFAAMIQDRFGEYFPKPIVEGTRVIWEEGPFEWTCVTMGTTICGPEFGLYSEPDYQFPEGPRNEYVFAEALNHYSIEFYEVD
jgi:hypothetical protein